MNIDKTSFTNAINDLLKIVLTLGIGALGSIIFIYLNLPIPWLLGAICATSFAVRYDTLPLKSPKIFSSPARVIIGVTIGSAFSPEILNYLNVYFFSLLLVIPFTIITILFGMFYYYKILNFDKRTAYFCSIPGGLIELVILGEQIKADTRKITLVQSSRLLFIILSLPFIIHYVFNVDVSGNQVITETLSQIDLKQLFYLVCIGTIGAIVGKKLNLFAAFLMGPMFLSIFAFSIGFVDSRPPDELLKFVQVIFGTIIGFTFKGIKLDEVIKTLLSTFGHFIILACITTAFTLTVSYFFDFPIMSILLAFAPGGQADINLIAIIVGANVPYIAIHHIVRLFLVMNLANIFAKKLE
ncbi:AbrB family transcriptional regulator [Arcobacter sp.]|uniref:AbrB family transcriptional regulator n=1 Tax=unclassified Arcobacter TaxID=2593671 RepID=UPI003AFFAE21